MKNTQSILFLAFLLIALWLMFFRKTDGFCGACAAA